MSTVTVTAPTLTASPGRTLARWLVSFAGYPLGGLAALLLTGPVASPMAAVAGGFLTGAVLGLVQAWALRADGPLLRRWTVATAAGLAVGLGVGASLVGFGTALPDLVVQGAVCGASVGLAQAWVLRRRTGPVALAWPVYLAGAWAVGWVVPTLIGVQVEQQFTVFGSSGAVVVALLTSVLPLVLRRDRSGTAGGAA